MNVKITISSTKLVIFLYDYHVRWGNDGMRVELSRGRYWDDATEKGWALKRCWGPGPGRQRIEHVSIKNVCFIDNVRLVGSK